jgi:hypothetical protein
VLLAVVLGPPAPAGAATIGPDPLPAPNVQNVCLSGQPCTFAATDPPSGVAYPSVSPVDGVVVRWRAWFVGPGTSNTARFRVLTKGANLGEYIADDGGDTETVGLGARSFGTRVQIVKGDLIGLDLGGTSTLGVGSRSMAGASIQRAAPPPADAVGFTFDDPFINTELVLNADVEADADDDGYGDVTQDLCPSDPGPEACDATRTVGAPDLTVPTNTFGDCFGAETCSLWTATTPIGGERQRWESPIDGVIVRWRVRLLNFAGPADPTLGPYRLRAIRKASDTAFPVVGSSAFESVPHDASKQTDTIHTFAARIPVLAGDRLALDMPPKKAAVPGGLRFDLRGGTHRLAVPAPPDGGSFSTSGGLFTQSPQFNADVEPDADRDGFGDVTQDACPTNTTTQGACPVAPADLVGPAVGISRRTRRLTRRGIVRVRLSCPAVEPAGCLAGRLRLTSAKRVQVAVRRIVRLGSKRFAIPAGRSKVVRIRLSRRNRALVRRRGRLRVRARASAVDQAGNRRMSTATFRLLPPRH